MHRIEIRKTLRDKILVSRESAQALVDQFPLQNKLSPNAENAAAPELEIDFAGVAGFAPSFFDELLAVIQGRMGNRCRIHMMSVPTTLSRRFELVLESRELRAKVGEHQSWMLEPCSNNPASP